METLKKYVRVLLNILIPIAAVVLLVFFGPGLVSWCMPLVIAWLISLIANPLVRFLERRLKIVRKHSSVVIVVLVLSLIVFVGYFLTVKLVEECIKFAADLPGLYELAAGGVTGILERFDRLFYLLPDMAQAVLSDFSENISTYLGDVVQKIGEPTFVAAGSVAKKIPDAFINILFTILFSYFLIAENENLSRMINKKLPESTSEKLRFLTRQMKHMAGGYVLAQIKIMVVVAVILLAGFLVLRVDYALLLSLLIAFLDFLPLFGTGTALLPWAAVSFLSGDYVTGVGLLIIYGATQGIRQIIQPKIVGETMGLNPLLTLVLLFLGYKLSGISGMILAVPVGIFAIEVYRAGFFDSMFENIKILIEDINAFRKKKNM